MTTIIFILELAALAALTICGALLLLDVRDKKKRPEDEPDQTEEWLKPPEHINCRCTIYYPLDKKRKCKRRPKGQTGRKHPKGKKATVERFLQELKKKTGSGNGIGNGTIFKLKRILDTMPDDFAEKEA